MPLNIIMPNGHMEITAVRGHSKHCPFYNYHMPMKYCISLVHDDEPHVMCRNCRVLITLPLEKEEISVDQATAPIPYEYALKDPWPSIDPNPTIDERIEKICQLWAEDPRESTETIDALERDIWKVLCGTKEYKQPSRMPLR